MIKNFIKKKISKSNENGDIYTLPEFYD